MTDKMVRDPKEHPDAAKVSPGDRRRMRRVRRLDGVMRRLRFISMIVPASVRARMRSMLLGARNEALFVDESKLVTFAVNGISLVAPAHFVRLYVESDYEPLLVRWLQAHLLPGMTTVDVGAHIGYLSIVMSRSVGPDGCVVAVEPAPQNLEYHRRNLEANGADNVRVVPCAASDQTGTRTFNITGSTDSHGFYDHPLTGTEQRITVTTTRLDDLRLGEVDLVKVDVEGAELEVLAGMSDLVASRVAWLVVEWGPATQRAAGRTPDELPRALEALGYSLTVLDDVLNRVRTVDDVMRLDHRGELEPWWYSNIVAVRQ